jgi:hypothetical protein
VSADDLGQWRDRQAILDCLTRFARGMDRFDRELVLSAFHAEAICDYGPYVGGPEGLCDWNDAIRPTVAATHHHLTNHSSEIAGDTAHAETYLIYSAHRQDGSVWQANGRYLDRLERRHDEWRLVTRYCVIESAVTLGTCELPFDGIADLYANGAPAQDRSDPSYRRPLTNRRAPRALGE